MDKVHEERIKTLFKTTNRLENRIDSLDEKFKDLNKLDMSIMSISMTLENLYKHSKKQDTLNERQNDTLEVINTNLINLNTKVNELERCQKNLDKRVTLNEQLHTIDIREVTLNKIKQLLIPGSIGALIGALIIELLKGG